MAFMEVKDQIAIEQQAATELQQIARAGESEKQQHGLKMESLAASTTLSKNLRSQYDDEERQKETAHRERMGQGDRNHIAALEQKRAVNEDSRKDHRNTIIQAQHWNTEEASKVQRAFIDQEMRLSELVSEQAANSP